VGEIASLQFLEIIKAWISILNRIGGSDPIGKVRLGYTRKKLEKKHWVEMVENPRRPIIHWHVLQVLL
jgi:hypothetical protein